MGIPIPRAAESKVVGFRKCSGWFEQIIVTVITRTKTTTKASSRKDAQFDSVSRHG